MVCLLSLDTSRDILKVLTLQEENITDPLMGIFNRRYLDRRLNEEVLRSKRYSLPLSVLLLDIDYFKKINDTYGHQIGDFVLKEVGKLIVSLVREVDIVVRYGGEEILIICTHTSDSNALILAERLRQKVEGFEMALPDIRDKSQRPIRITVSIGVAGLSQTTLDYHKLIEDVDRALYTAKKKGRNVVIVNDDANC
jgi:diguanylate cyclase (GGDEF)-like protein